MSYGGSTHRAVNLAELTKYEIRRAIFGWVIYRHAICNFVPSLRVEITVENRIKFKFLSRMLTATKREREKIKSRFRENQASVRGLSKTCSYYTLGSAGITGMKK